MSLNPITKTAGDVATYVKRQFGDESGVQITDTDIWRWINSAQLEIIAKNAVIKALAKTDVVAGQADYDLSTLSIHQIESIHWNERMLVNVPFSEVERYLNSDTDDASGSPTVWWEWAGVITLYPKPQEDLTEGLRVYYSKMPLNVAIATDPLSVADKYFEAICSWVLSKAYELDEEFDQAANQRTFFSDRLAEQNGEEREAAHMTYPVIGDSGGDW